MAHTYVITSVMVTGDQVTITGTVDAVPVVAIGWVSASPGSFASAIAFRNYSAALMLAALPPQPTANPALLQTFTQ